MRKAICMAVLAIITFGSVYASPISNGKTITAVSDTTKKKMKTKMKGDTTKMKSKTMKTKMKMKKDTMKTKM